MTDARKIELFDEVLSYCVDRWLDSIDNTETDVILGLKARGLTKDEAIDYLIEFGVADSGENEREYSMALEEIYGIDVKRRLNGYIKPTIKETIAYLENQGTDVDDINIDYFREECEHLGQAWECVHENYDLCDFDRWMHLEEIFGCEMSWNCFLKIDSALYEEDIEILELGYTEEEKQREIDEANAQYEAYVKERNSK